MSFGSDGRNVPHDSRSYHVPDGNPCLRCGLAPYQHRVKHKPTGDPCACGVPLAQHRTRSAGEKKRSTHKYSWKQNTYYVGVDGEGRGRDPHIYYLLAACDETGERKWYVENPAGLSTVECLSFLVNLPKHARCFAYSFNYDLTKILKDLPDEALYRLFRPESRKGKRGPRAILWSGFRINLLSTKFTVEDTTTRKRRVVWDIWKFFRGKFVSALLDWKVDRDLKLDLAFMSEMKEKRAHLDQEDNETVLRYCLQECRCLAALVKKLVQAHIDAELPLRAFFGAGSTASALLDKMNIRDLRGDGGPDEMAEAVASAFFGGRFEHIVVGPIAGPVYSYDISSAYPYQLCFLPCLVCARWERTKSWRRVESARHACIRYQLPDTAFISDMPWAAFPFRLSDGTIIFPGVSGGGWVWRDEYLSALRLFPDIEFCEAWVLESDCSCGSPFTLIPQVYRERARLGKDAAGIVLKLGINSNYGKLAQSSGSAPYQSWIWAGMVTSGCRAQILDFLALHSDPCNMLMVATDGIYTRERISTPYPRDTGTSDMSKPLGGWEEKILANGVFAARPGVYFPLNPSDEDIAQFRARGLSKTVLVREWKRIVEAYEAGLPEVEIPSVARFVGAKSGTIHSRRGYSRTASCGEWVERQIRLSFTSLPKRATTEGQYLTIRNLTTEETSLPYKRSLLSEDAVQLRLAELEAEEQPDGGDYTDYDA